MNPLITKRYAKALLLAATDEAEMTSIEAELNAVQELYLNSPLRVFFENPAFQRLERLEIVKAMSLSPKLQRCVEILVENGRAPVLGHLAKAYTHELDTKLGRLRVQVTTAYPLKDEQLQALSQALFSRLGQKIITEPRVDTRVRAGIRAQIGGLVFDNTIESQFSELRRVLCS
ncbi:MAG: ATP synthase F1 subunit delta [Deltaproteobacteria bacterium]|nr:ATP synthase F1 subunit delta [Deltaproteobacteria bacterium]